MEKYIYARVSRDDLTTDNQTHHLLQLYPDAKVFTETISGAEKDKPVLNQLLAALKSGDTLIVSALDRLGRMSGASIVLMDSLLAKGVKVISIREGIDYSTSSGKLIAQIHFAVAENERNLISERTKKSLQRLKAEGKRLGPPRKVTAEQIAHAKLLHSEQHTLRYIAQMTGLSKSHVHKLVKSA